MTGGRNFVPSAPLGSDEPVDEVLEIFLLAGLRLGVELGLEDAVGDLLEAALARKHSLALALVPAGIAGLAGVLERPVLEDRRGCLEAAGEHIEAADMAVDEIDRIDRLA